VSQSDLEANAARAATDRAYRERNQVVVLLCKMALALGYLVWRQRTDIEGWEAVWHNCVYIGLPNGQVSWHYHDREMEDFAFVPELEIPYDGHTTEEKYERVKTCNPFNVYGKQDAQSSAMISQLESKIEELEDKLLLGGGIKTS
jgi:hypothetical protein